MNKKIFVSVNENKIVFRTFNLTYSDFMFENFIDKNKFKNIVINLIQNKLILKNDDYNNVKKLIDLLSKIEIEVIIEKNASEWLKNKRIHLNERSIIGQCIKSGNFYLDLQKWFNEYKNKIEKDFIARPLSDFQLVNSFYLSIMKRCSNFSVPGSGKTTTCLAAYNYLHFKEKVKRLIIIGPKSSFKSWRDEYYACFKKVANYFTSDMLGASSEKEKKMIFKILLDSNKIDIFFFNYESVPKKIDEIKEIILNDSLLIFDEAHKIKSLKGKWATACKEISSYAGYRFVLTGTPIPNGYQDIYNILQILYSEEYEDFFNWKYEDLKNNKHFNVSEFRNKLSPFFIRTTKNDLRVPPPNPDNIIEFELSENEVELYEQIIRAYRSNFFALCIRLLQSLSSPKSLLKNLEQYQLDEEIDEVESSKKNVIEDFFTPIKNQKILDLVDSIKSPTKIEKVIQLIRKLKSENKKIMVWSIFLEPMYLIKSLLKDELSCKIINGQIKQCERDDIINEFQKGEIDLLISNPQTMAESVSIHQHCHDAIYIDFSFNLVHMLQSKDRIHRFGLPSDVETNYYFFIPNNLDKNIDNMIYKRLKEKEKLMLDSINSENIEPLNARQEYTYKEIAENIAKEILE